MDSYTRRVTLKAAWAPFTSVRKSSVLCRVSNATLMARHDCEHLISISNWTQHPSQSSPVQVHLNTGASQTQLILAQERCQAVKWNQEHSYVTIVLQYPIKAKSTNRSSLQKRNNTVLNSLQRHKHSVLQKTNFEVYHNVLLCTLSSKILLCPLKGPHQKHTLKMKEPNHTHTRHQHPNPRSGCFSEWTPTSRFQLEIWKKLAICRK